MNNIIDTHCHLDFRQFDEDRSEVINRARIQGIKRIVVPAVDLDGCTRVVGLAERYEEVYAAVGVHPNSSAGWEGSWLDRLRDFANHPKVVAIGEIGLDYYREHSPPETQREAFSLQLELAAEIGLPVIVHNRQASNDVLAMLKQSPQSDCLSKGVLHSFSGEWDTAQTALDMGYYLGFTGPVTFKNADSLRSIAKRVPLKRLLVETDSPYLAPQKYRGRRNEPSFVALVVKQLAALHAISKDELARITTDNAIRLFGKKLGFSDGQSG
jgi:TatD DNase family protein